MYRFRTIQRLLKGNELENQEIYFSDISSLNDPIEGFREIYWKGDITLWKNFIRHYLLCLENAIVSAKLFEDDKTFRHKDIQVFINLDYLPTKIDKDIHDEVYETFLGHKKMPEYLEHLASRSDGINQDELFYYLRLIHMFAIKSIIEIHVAHEPQLAPDKPSPDFSDFILKSLPALEIFKTEIKENHKSKLELFHSFKQIMNGLDLIQAYNLKSESNKYKQYFIFSDFPSAYIKHIEKLLYPDSYVACFTKNCTNPVVWSHYGDRHTGVALKFNARSLDNTSVIDLRGIVEGNQIDGKRGFQFEKVIYSNEFPKINFFASLGRLTHSQIMSWHTDIDGNNSVYRDQLVDENKWIQEYWAQSDKSFLIKLKDWEHEDEYRLILTDIMDRRVDKNNRKLKYDFDDLEGIVFGIKTPLDDKIKIIDIIKNKCRQYDRKDFEFYQTQFAESTGEIKVERIWLNLNEIN